MESIKVRCPKCKWEPDGKPYWRCSCGHKWDTFSTGGRCPACQKVWEETQCIEQAGGCKKLPSLVPTGSKSPFLNNSHQLVPEFIADRNLFSPDVDRAGLYLVKLPDIDDKRIVHPGKRRLQLSFDIL